MRNFLIGLSYALLWATAGVANKFGLAAGGQPLLMTNIRFLIAAALLLLWVHGIQKNAMPKREDWKPLLLYGLLNNTIYMSLFIYGLKNASAGISTLSLALNPLIISVLSSFWFKKEIKSNIWVGLFLGMTGVAIATFPLLQKAIVNPVGMSFLLASMLCYSIGTVFFANKKWTLSKLVINTWQIFFGALLMLPITFLFSSAPYRNDNIQYWAAILWLTIPVTIVAVQLWLNLLSIDAVKASLWLFVCPIFGFTYAYFTLGEPITGYTLTGTCLVVGGLYLGQKNN
jgi:probable blue pigment (indigoidine) exporter